MPKRKKTIEYYENKIRKIRLKTAKRRRLISDSSTDSEENQDVGSQEHYEAVTPLALDSNPELEQTPEVTSELLDPQPDVLPTEISVSDLDPELLLALGDATEDAPIYGEKIHHSLAQRWLPILKKGLTEDCKTKLHKEYPIPDNCRLLKAPTLNPEILAAVLDVVKNRDKSIQTKQDQLGHGITAINKAITLLLLSDDKVQAIKILSDGCRLLTDLHYTETQLRTKLITPCLQKSVLSAIENQERDETLFGVSLPDKIKSSKAIDRQGQQIKKAATNKPSSKTPSSSFTRSRYQENWQGPPRYPSSNRGGRGGLHHRAPLTQFRRIQASSTTSTSRGPPTSYLNKQRAPRQ